MKIYDFSLKSTSIPEDKNLGWWKHKVTVARSKWIFPCKVNEPEKLQMKFNASNWGKKKILTSHTCCWRWLIDQRRDLVVMVDSSMKMPIMCSVVVKKASSILSMIKKFDYKEDSQYRNTLIWVLECWFLLPPTQKGYSRARKNAETGNQNEQEYLPCEARLTHLWLVSFKKGRIRGFKNYRNLWWCRKSAWEEPFLSPPKH